MTNYLNNLTRCTTEKLELYTGEYRFENWGKHEYSQALGRRPIKKKIYLKTLAEPLDSKVYFAGEIFDPYNKWGFRRDIVRVPFHGQDACEIEEQKKI